MNGCPYCGHDEFRIEISLSGGAAADAGITCGKCGRKLTREQIMPAEPPAPPPPPPPAVAAALREPVPERERSDVLLSMATPDIYRRNPFRVTGLNVTASQREMARQADKLKMFERLGTAPTSSASGLPLDPPPDTETIREAMQRLQDPEKRLVDEIFWIWPLPGGSDEALDSFNSGDAKKAEDLWRREDDGPNRDVARHNLAVLHHARLVESDSASERDWKEVLDHWRTLITQEALWSRLTIRTREIDDPRLTTGTVRRLRLTLPLALLSFNARLAAEAAERGDFDRAKRHRDIVLASGFDQETIDEALSMSVASLRERLQTLCNAAGAESDAEPARGHKIAKKLLEQTLPLRLAIMAVLPSDNPTRIGALDEVALKALGCEIIFGNKTEQWQPCAELLPKVLEIAVSESARTRIQREVDAVKTNNELSKCWFCGVGKARSEHAAEVKMYGNVQHTQTWEGTRTTWNHGAIPVPRCEACKSRHLSAADKAMSTGCLGSLLGVGSCIGMVNVDALSNTPLPGVVGITIITVSIVAGLVWKRAALAGVKGEGAAKKHSSVLAKKKEGWVIGEYGQ
ncbi:MAG TPA: hypothetical protein VM557_11460 [Thermoanaerobaculia bacterium]|nr:hypothetical protein [Thermoanaerobaculia bacterium]